MLEMIKTFLIMFCPNDEYTDNFISGISKIKKNKL